MSEKFRWPFPQTPHSLWWKISSAITLATVASLSKLWLCCLNSTKVYKEEIMRKTVLTRPKGISLITVSNHHGCMDDAILTALVPLKAFFSPSTARWTPGAHDICFTKSWHGTFFALGQTVPIVRGDGVFQRGMDFTLEQLKRGAWVHIFPEGRVNMQKAFIRFKWGVGRLISECPHVPIVVPIYHLGADDTLPNYQPYIPRVGKKVTVLVGEPIDFEPLLIASKKLGHSSLQVRKNITDVLQEEIEKLRIKTTKLHMDRFRR